MARTDEERSSQLLARERDAEKRWKASLAARLQHERKVEAQQEKDQIRRSIILGRLLLADMSPEARALLDGYIGGLKHAQDLKLFAPMPATPDPRAVLPSLAGPDIRPGIHAADGEGTSSMPESPSLLVAVTRSDWDDGDALLYATSDGASDPGHETLMEELDDASPLDLEAEGVPSARDQAVEIETDSDDAAASDVDGRPAAERDAVLPIDLHSADAETAPSDDDRMDVEAAEPSPAASQNTEPLFVPLVYDTPHNTRMSVEALGLGIRRQALNDGSYRWGAFATTLAQSRALEELGLKLIGPADASSLPIPSMSDRNVRRRVALGAEPRIGAHQVPPLIYTGEPFRADE